MERDDEGERSWRDGANEEALPDGTAFSQGVSQRAASANRRNLQHVWLISYSDFMTILMIFFLAMYGYAHLARLAISQPEPRMSYADFKIAMDRLAESTAAGVEVSEEIDRIRIQMPASVFFDSGSATLAPSALSTIEELAESIILVEGRLVVEGHADNVPTRGGQFQTNWELSAARAFSMINALTERGIQPDRMAAWGFGETRPVASNATEAGRAQNRRIELVLLKSVTPGT